MLRTTFLICLLQLLAICQLGAQTSSGRTSFSARIIDSADRKPLSFVTVALQDAGGKPIKTTLTNDNGIVQFDKLLDGNLRIAIGAVGYRSRILSLESLLNQIGGMPDILLSRQSQQLKEVVVTGVKPLVKQEGDKIIYDIESDPDSRHENMLQMMRKVPFLSLDADDKLLMNGGTDYKVLIDGRSTGMMARSPQDALRTMRAQAVKRVEVITSPSAKYDSEGAAGVINIITNRSMIGSLLYLLIHKNTRIGYGFESSATVKKGNFGMYVWTGYWWHDVVPNDLNNLRSNLTPDFSTIRQQGRSKTNGTDFPIAADFSCEIDTLNLLNASFSTGRSRIRNRSNQRFDAYDEVGAGNYAYLFNNRNLADNSVIDFGLNYQLGFRSSKNRILTAAYKYSKSENDFDNESFHYEVYQYPDRQTMQRNTSGMNEQTVQADYTTPLKKVTMDAGAKVILRDNFSENMFDNSNGRAGQPVATVDALEYQQNIIAAYNSYQFNIKKWGFRAGARLEYTGINADFISNQQKLNRDFTNLIPSVGLNRRLSPQLNASAGYSQRIQRPAIWQLNPFVNESNPLYHTSGNPDLRPALFHTFDLNLSRFKKASYNFNLNYTFARNTIQSIAVMKNDTAALATFNNVGKNNNMSLNTSFNIPLSSKLSASLNWSLRYLFMEGMVNSTLFQNEGFAANGSTSIGWRFPIDLNVNARLLVNSSQPTLQGKNGGYFTHYIDVQKFFLNKKMQLRLNIYSPLRKHLNIENDLSGAGFLQVNTMHRVQRGAYMALSYTFGQLKDRMKKARTRVNNDDLSAPPKEQ